jgi:hypothetical protein
LAGWLYASSYFLLLLLLLVGTAAGSYGVYRAARLVEFVVGAAAFVPPA